MIVVRDLADLRAHRASLPNPHGFVPTMGFLHEGHLSLVRQAKRECRSVGVSIFVNPSQFGPQEDLAAYPRDLPRDLALLGAEGVDLVWTPDAGAIYPPDFQTWVTVDSVSRPLEGERRPGHFRGVATIVAKLLHAFEPQRAYFGQKDAQQTVVVRRMTADLAFDVEVVVCPTVREADGLALSSRNTYLSAEERRAAPVLYRSLAAAEAAFAAGEREAARLRDLLSTHLKQEPLVQTQYVSVADPETLDELQGHVTRALFSMAVFIGKTRLIDNVLVGDRQLIAES